MFTHKKQVRNKKNRKKTGQMAKQGVYYTIMKILVINGPNLQLLGRRKAEFYGTGTLAELEETLKGVAESLGVDVDFFQSNHEGALCDVVADAIGKVDGIVINPAAYTHTSVALRDALEAARIPAIEVHLSNITARDEFRKISLTAPVCIGQIAGLGADGYEWAMRALVKKLKENS